jgi:flagellar biosynthesis chaperone FliJ
MVKTSQEKINSNRAELEEAIKHRMKGVLTSVDQQHRTFLSKLDVKIGEYQLELRTSLDSRNRSLRKVLQVKQNVEDW